MSSAQRRASGPISATAVPSSVGDDRLTLADMTAVVRFDASSHVSQRSRS
jgi:hypothetical protein